MRVILMAIVVLFTFCSAEKKTVMNFSNPIHLSSGEWKKIDSLIKVGQPNKALELVEQLLPTLSSDDNLNHYLKAVRYKIKLLTQVKEDEGALAYEFILTEINKASEVSAPLVKYIEAKWLEDMSASNSRFFKDDDKRDFTKTVFTEWGHFQYESKLIELWDEIISESNPLFDIPVKELFPLLKKEESTEHVMPTAYDFIYAEYLNFLRNDRFSVAKPKKLFNQWNNSLVVDKNEFIKLDIHSVHKNDLKGKSLQAYQKWLTKHIQRNQYKTALVHVDLLRLNYLNQEINQDENINWIDVYDNGFGQNKGTDERFLYLLEKSKFIVRNSTPLKNPKVKRLSSEAQSHSDLSKIASEVKDEYVLAQIKAFKHTLERPYLDVQLENTYQPGRDILYRFAFKNIAQAKLAIHKLTKDEVKEYFVNRNRGEAMLKNWPVIREYDIPIVKNNHLQSFSSEGMIAPLPLGFYVFSVKSKAQFGDFNASENLTIVQVTDLGLILGRDEQLNISTYFRSSGLPAANVTVDFYQLDFNREQGDLNLLNNSKTSDHKGQVDVDFNNRRSVHVLLTKGEDQYFTTQPQYFYKNRKSSYKTQKRATVFIDRGIYRPGQEVHFKVLRYNLTPYPMSKPNIIVGERLKIHLFNANGQEVEVKQVTTNDFGSASGSFLLPDGGLTGKFSVRVHGLNGTRYFSVEEYKRPKFKVEVNQPEGLLSYDKTISVPGLAMSYAGVAIENAEVSYKVTRSLSYPYRYCWWFPPFPANEQIIKVGKTMTNADGSFEIDFNLVKDKATKKGFSPITQYLVEVDVVDGNGETRSGSASIHLGDKPFYIQSDLGQLRETEDRLFNLTARNAAGSNISAKGHYEIHQIVPLSNKPFINKLWQAADYKTISDSDFSNKFPWISQQDHTDMSLWKVGDLMEKNEFEFNGKDQRSLPSNLSVGAYKISYFDDNSELISEQYFSTYSTRDKSAFIVGQFDWKLDAESYTVGDVAQLAVMSPWKNSVAHIKIVHSNGNEQEQTLDFDQTLKTVDIPINENDRGGVSVFVTHIIHNRVVTESIFIPVPWSNKELIVKWQTFRDKTMPNAEEKYNVTITKKEGDFERSEMLVTMYDKSLDVFAQNEWNVNLWPTFRTYNNTRAIDGQVSNVYINFNQSVHPNGVIRTYPTFNDHFRNQYYRNHYRGFEDGGEPMMRAKTMNVQVDAVIVLDEKDEAQSGGTVPPSSEKPHDQTDGIDFSPRENLNETVFFYPHIEIDREGNGVIEFKMNEALTTWKMNIFVHDKSLAFGHDVQEVITQKEIMVFPQLPRFFRSGDEIILSTKVNRLNSTVQSGYASIKLLNAITGEDVTSQFIEKSRSSFSFKENNSLTVNWTCRVPENFVAPLDVIIGAESGSHQDAEKVLLEVVSNKVFLTEALPLHVPAQQDKTFVFKALKDLNPDDVVSASFELTQNPIWFAIKSLPYIMDSDYESNVQLANQYFANRVGGYISDQYPSVKKTFSAWEKNGNLSSPLEQKQHLKISKLEESPWVRNAKNETQRAADIAKAFNDDKLNVDAKLAMNKLIGNQMGSGAFSWFGNKYPNFHVTNSVLLAFGHERKITKQQYSNQTKRMIRKAIQYVDRKIEFRYGKIVDKKNYATPSDIIRYLYVRSFFLESHPVANGNVVDYFFEHISDIYNQGLSVQGMAALSAKRFNKTKLFESIYASLNDKVLVEEEMGAFWKYQRGAYWQERPLETHTLLMELFSEAGAQQEMKDNLSLWLLKNKQTNQWDNSVATSRAIYALLLNSGRWKEDAIPVAVKVFGNEVSTTKGFTSEFNFINKISGSDYYLIDIDKRKIKNESVKMKNKNDHAVWGAVYTQFFKPIQSVERYEETGLDVKKKLFKVTETDQGEKMVAVSDQDIRVGDLIRVALDVQVDRDMEYVHIKDLRGIGFEPVDVISNYRSFGSVQAFQVTKDLSSNFFVSYLSKGSHTLTYDVRVFNAGTYSDGLAQIQCIYAPEFISHSEGNKISVNRY